LVTMETDHVASTLRDADFVFFVMLDADSPKIDEVAVVVSPSDYQEANGNLDVLRNAAVWQSDNHFRNAGAEAALATFTAGMSVIFHHADVVAGLVKQFHEDVLGK
jgi:hypothetical protein